MQYNIEELKQAAITVVEKNKLPAITNQTDFATAGDLLKLLKNKRAALEDERKTFTDPLLRTQKKIKAEFDKAGEPIDTAIETIEGMMKEFWKAEKIRVDIAQLLLDTEAAKNAGVDGALVPIVNDIKTTRGDIASTSVRELTRYRVTDITLVPLKFLMVDDKLMKAHIDTDQKAPAGIEYYTELSVTSR
jgi:hypothetical protein